MLLRIVTLSLRNLRRRPFRTLLILQGVIWGTAMGVVPPAIIQGSLQNVEENATRFGTDRLLLSQDLVDVRERFSWELVESLRERYGDRITHATGIALLPTDDFPLLLVGGDSLGARGLELERGRGLEAADLEGPAPVCLLEAELAGSLLDGKDPLGAKLRVKSDAEGVEVRLEVVGITAPRPAETAVMDDLGYSRDHPLRDIVESFSRTMGYFEDGESGLLRSDLAMIVPHGHFSLPPRWIELRAHPREVIALRDELREDLAARGYEPVILTNAILPVLYGTTLDTVMELHDVVFFLAILVGTSVVGALMVLSVMERGREIAIRRVEGARRWHIAVQFVVETGTLCTVGGLLGVPLGVLLSIVRCALESQASVTWTFPVVSSLEVVAVVSAVGLACGLLPAWRATRIDPVEMLRHE